MGARKTQFELDQIMGEHNVSRLWSWSRYSTSQSDLYGYFLKYIMKVKPDQIPSIYGSLGGHVHDLLESLYKKEITREEALESYKDKAIELDIYDQKFSRADEDRNDSIGARYHACNEHFFENCNIRRGDNEKLEEFITIKIGRQLFIGYVDLMYEKDGILYIEDFKTSSMYSKKKQEENSGQLRLYALGMIQQGWTVDKIKIGWFFTKYVTIRVAQKNGNVRETTCLRSEIGSKLVSSAKSWLGDKKECKKYDVTYDENDIERLLEELVESNSIECLPQHIQEKFEIGDCFVDADLSQEILDDMVATVTTNIADIVKREYEYDKTQDDGLFYVEVTKENEFFFANLSDYTAKYHKPYRSFLETQAMFKTDIEDEDGDSVDSLMKELGLM